MSINKNILWDRLSDIKIHDLVIGFSSKCVPESTFQMLINPLHKIVTTARTELLECIFCLSFSLHATDIQPNHLLYRRTHPGRILKDVWQPFSSVLYSCQHKNYQPKRNTACRKAGIEKVERTGLEPVTSAV